MTKSDKFGLLIEMKLRDQLHPFYQNWIPYEWNQFLFHETLATCDNCAMQKSPLKKTKLKSKKSFITYDKNLKCCTFEPLVMNFFVGELLNQTQASGAIEEKIKSRRGILPIGISPDIDYQIRFLSRGPKDFGNREDLLCSYYDNGKCQIWKNRGSVCTTFFCKSIYGKKGIQFWQDLGHYLHALEMSVAEEALLYLGFSARQVSLSFKYHNQLDNLKTLTNKRKLPEKFLKEVWLDYYGDEVSLFKKTYEIVGNFSRKEVESLTPGISQKFRKQIQKTLDDIFK